MAGDDYKFLIIGTGRSGTSLLSAILADAGADFAMPNSADWNQTIGYFEHGDVQKAGKAFEAAEQFKPFVRGSWLARKRRRYYMAIVKSSIRRLLGKADYAKSIGLVWLTHTIYRLGFQPKVIIVHRAFEDIATSAHLSFGWTYEETERRYLDIYRTGLVQTKLFGGCVIAYEEIIDPAETAWAEALAALTGFDEQSLLESRRRRVQGDRRNNTPVLPLNTETDRLSQALSGLKGKVIEPQGGAYPDRR
jgi:hypothetical protein